MKAAGARKALILPVSGAFHSPLMATAKEALSDAVKKITFYNPNASIYQNVVARAVVDKEEIKRNLIDQMTGPVRWTQSVQSMIRDGASKFTEIGPGKVLQGLVLKINKEMQLDGVS